MSEGVRKLLTCNGYYDSAVKSCGGARDVGGEIVTGKDEEVSSIGSRCNVQRILDAIRRRLNGLASMTLKLHQLRPRLRTSRRGQLSPPRC